jgi:hypothetical protein
LRSSSRLPLSPGEVLANPMGFPPSRARRALGGPDGNGRGRVLGGHGTLI